jgi:hypothetical protein
MSTEPSAFRDDESFFWTMVKIYQRLSLNLIVYHPITTGETITKSSNDPKMRFLRDKILISTKRMNALFATDCTYKKAAATWNSVFHTDYF